MRKNEVKVGTVYRVKVSGNVCDVRITGENPHGGWDGVNVATNRKVRVKSAQRLRSVAAPRPAKRQVVRTLAEADAAKKPQAAVEAATTGKPTGKRIMTKAEYEAEAKAEAAKDGVAETVATVEKGNLAEGVTVPAAGKKKRQPRADKPVKERKTSGLDAAAQVLAEAGQPMGCKEMVERMLAKGLWQTGGKTPAATIYSAIIREIAVKGDDSRFRKVDRGRFELAKGA